jgi:serine phosphatase RsbU (regulator of sigma subunit)
MDIQAFRVTFSLGTKLLLIIATFLLLTTLFLSVSAVYLVTGDKQAYTFQTQSIEAGLVGRELVTVFGHVSDTLRLSLASVDLAGPVGTAGGDALRSVARNQSDLEGIGLGYLNNQTGDLKILTYMSQPSLAQADPVPTDSSSLSRELSSEWVKTALSHLIETGIGFVNLSRANRAPVLGILIEDRAAPPGPDGVPVAVGILPLAGLMGETQDLDLTIATQSGWLLFDTNPAAVFDRSNISSDPLFTAALRNPVRSGTLDYSSPQGRFLGSYAKPGFDLVVLSREAWDRAMRARDVLTEKFALLGCMAIGLGTVFTILFSKTLTAPINRLYEATRLVGEGEFDIEMRPGSRDEIGALTWSFNVMSSKIRELLKASVEKAILEKEIDIASTVQRTLIPESILDVPGIELRAHYQSASSCGGDWWGQFMIGGKMVVGVADATGHGLSSALITASARSCFSMIQHGAERDPSLVHSPSAMLDHANRVIFDCAKGNIMMTFFMAVIDLENHTLTYANAAHNPPWLFSRKGDGEYQLNSLVSSGTRLGEALELAQPIAESTLPIGAGDIFFLYTDGLTEGTNQAKEMYGKKRVRKAVERSLSSGPAQIVSELMRDFLDHNQGKSLDDDVTIIAMRLKGIGDAT